MLEFSTEDHAIANELIAANGEAEAEKEPTKQGSQEELIPNEE